MTTNTKHGLGRDYRALGWDACNCRHCRPTNTKKWRRAAHRASRRQAHLDIKEMTR